jgi:hypothetical protein
MVDRDEQEQERLGRIVDGLPAGKLLQVMNETVGLKRSAELVGWAVLWGLQGAPSGRELRLRLEGQGLTEASAYRALADYRRVSDALMKQEGYKGVGVFASLRALAAFLA